MRPLVNLSSQPFRNHRLFWLGILLLFAVPSYFGINAVETMARRDLDIARLDGEIQKLQASLKKTEKPSSSNVTISTDQNRQLVAASELVARRSFSWSQLLNDIERNLPATVRVLRITVSQILSAEREGGGADNAVTLAMTIIGKSQNEALTMINKFHDSNRFKVTPISSKKIEGTEDVEFELKVEYFPPAPAPASRAGLSNQIAEKKQ